MHESYSSSKIDQLTKSMTIAMLSDKLLYREMKIFHSFDDNAFQSVSVEIYASIT